MPRDLAPRHPIPPRPKPPETIKASRTIEIERKTFQVDFCENMRGSFIRIKEIQDRMLRMIVIPADGIDALMDAIDEVYPPAEGAGK